MLYGNEHIGTQFQRLTHVIQFFNFFYLFFLKFDLNGCWCIWLLTRGIVLISVSDFSFEKCSEVSSYYSVQFCIDDWKHTLYLAAFKF